MAGDGDSLSSGMGTATSPSSLPNTPASTISAREEVGHEPPIIPITTPTTPNLDHTHCAGHTQVQMIQVLLQVFVACSNFMPQTLMVHFSVLLHRRHLVHTYVGFDCLRCLTLTHHNSCTVIGSSHPPLHPPITDPNTPLSLVLD